MIYKRTEYFRYVFGAPFEAQFRLVLDEKAGTKSGRGKCKLLDLSPGGAKLTTEYDIPFEREPVQLALEFMLFQERIEVTGNLVWKTQLPDAYQYGFEYDPGFEKERLIIEELKLLSKAEMEENQKQQD